VISIGTVTSKIACGSGETGDAPNTTAQFTPILDGLSVWVFPEKLPVTLLAEQGALSQLGNEQGKGTAYQLDCSTSTSTQCTNTAIATTTPQQGEVATTGFLNPIQTTTTTVTKGGK